MKKQIFRIGVKNFPPDHGGVETATQYFVDAARELYDFTVFTVWRSAVDSDGICEKAGKAVKVYKLAKGWYKRFVQIKTAVIDKRNTILDFQMEMFVPLAVVFTILGYNVVATFHGLSWHNPKMSYIMHCLVWLVDVIGVNVVGRSVFVARQNYDTMKRYTLRTLYHIPNGSFACDCIINDPPNDIVFIGRISIQKNIIGIIEAADRYHRNIDLYGPIDEREKQYTQKVMAALATSKYARYCGKIASKDVYSVISQYRYLINASPEEASPNSVIEAGACGLWLYLSDIAGHRNIGYKDCYYFTWNDITLPQRGIEESARSKNNIKFHQDHLSIQRQVNQYKELYGSF